MFGAHRCNFMSAVNEEQRQNLTSERNGEGFDALKGARANVPENPTSGGVVESDTIIRPSNTYHHSRGKWQHMLAQGEPHQRPFFIGFHPPSSLSFIYLFVWWGGQLHQLHPKIADRKIVGSNCFDED